MSAPWGWCDGDLIPAVALSSRLEIVGASERTFPATKALSTIHAAALPRDVRAPAAVARLRSSGFVPLTILPFELRSNPAGPTCEYKLDRILDAPSHSDSFIRKNKIISGIIIDAVLESQ